MSETATAATARIEGLAPFAALLRQVTPLVDETRVELRPEGIRVEAVDPANVGYIDATIGAHAFDSYETDGVVMGCNLTFVEDVFERNREDVRGILAPDSQSVLTFDEDARELKIDTDTSSYRIDTISPENIRKPTDPNGSDIPWTATLTLPAVSFGRTVEDADVVDDYVVYGWDDDADEFYATAEGDVHAYEFRDEAIDADADGDARSKFSLSYLRRRAPVLPGTGTVEVTLGQTCPMLVEYEFADGDGHVEWMLAPRRVEG